MKLTIEQIEALEKNLKLANEQNNTPMAFEHVKAALQMAKDSLRYKEALEYIVQRTDSDQSTLTESNHLLAVAYGTAKEALSDSEGEKEEVKE